MIRRLPIRFSLFLAAVAAAVVQGAQSVTVCSAGECLTGQSNITRLGAVLSSSQQSYVLLPGQYTTTVQPATLEQAFTGATSTITFTTGFSNSTTPSTPSLPISISLLPGLLNYPADLYSGEPNFLSLPQGVNSSFTATSINRGSIILSANTVAAIQADNNGAKSRIVIWDTVPYMSQLPYDMAGNLEVLSIQSSSCSPACSSSATCSISGTCVCPPNFTGSSCEACATGHFGPECKACPTGCTNCDQGITGTGACLSVTLPANAPANCNCQNGVCGTGGTCTCSTGWTTSGGTNSTQCNACADGFFLDSSGNCEACGARCSKCADTTGTCTQCNTGLTVNSFQPQLCGIVQQCADGQFASGTTCSVCSAACTTCSGPAATDCIKCAANTFLSNGQCVGISTVPASGVCTGTSLVANPLKGVCDNCPLGCSACQYAVFSASSQYSDVKCTKCTPGKVLSGNQCIDSCPDGTFVGSDGFTCTACSSTCGTCVNSADYCLTCKNNQLASAGTCVSTCPSNMFSNNGACISCHPDCASCSGAGFNQCLTCPAANPILTSAKRCVTTCAKTEYFDSSSGTCKSCDSSCASCSDGGSSSCLSCAGTNDVLRGGKCIYANCGNGEGPTSGLGACLAELVIVPSNSGTPPVSIPPIDPNASQPSSGGHKLLWWQILLIVIGILLLLAIILLIWRRRQRKKRAEQTEQFKANLKRRSMWGRMFRNPFAAWWARRRDAQLNRRSDVERMSHAKDWRTTAHTGADAETEYPYSSDRRTAVDVPKSIGRGSWFTTPGRRPSMDGRSYASGAPLNNPGLGAIREGDEWDRERDRDRYTEKSYRSRRYEDSRRGDSEYEPRQGESRYYAQEIEQDDSRSERTRSERTYDPFQFPRPSSRNSDDKTDLVSIIRSEVPESERRWEDKDSRRQYERSRSGYGRSERSNGRSYREDRSYRQDYPASVSTESQSRSYRRDRDDRRYPTASSSSQGPDTPSMYSQPTLPHIRPPPPAAMPFDIPINVEPPRDAVLSSRFSMSTTAASTHPPTKIKRKEVPEPVPTLEAPRQLTDAEMYKMSKLFPDLLSLVSPTKKDRLDAVGNKSPSRNPFRI